MKIEYGKIRFDKMITINLKKYIDDSYYSLAKEAKGLKYKWFKLYIAGFFDSCQNKIVLIYSDFMLKLMKKRNISIEKQICYTLSHEVMHKILLDDHNIKVTKKFDNIAEKLIDYGVW